MANEKNHIPLLELYESPPAEIEIDSEIVLKIKLACTQGCDLGELPLVVEDADGRVLAHLPPSAEAVREVTMKTPTRTGEQSWRLRSPAHEQDGVRHEECTISFAFKTRPHTTSLAVWAVPSPVLMGNRFSINVGAKSSADCTLAGRQILISDAGGAVVASGALRDAPWPGTSALYWTEVELPAPAQEGLAWYTVNFAAKDAAIPHDGSVSKFSVAIVRPGEHRLSIAVLEKDTRTPIEDAQIRLGAYGAATDASGRAEVAVPKGSYELTVWKAGYDAPPRTLEIGADVGIEIEADIVPPENPYAPWTA
jgi:hypothetical protein